MDAPVQPPRRRQSATLDKIRLAHEREPALLQGTWVSAAMLDYIRTAAAA
jgi:hypothetical protein